MKLGYEWLPGNISPNPAWLAASLQEIYGDSLIGLWIGEDTLTDGSGNITSWPGRVGPTATPISTGRFQQVVENGRRVANNTSTTARAGLTVTIEAPKASICVGRAASLPFPQYNALADWGNGAQVGVSGNSTWYAPAGITHWTNGVASEYANTSLSVFEADLPINTTSNLLIGGNVAIQERNWLGSIGLVMVLSAVPTQLQRLQTQLILDTYYRPTYASAAKLALDLYGALSTSILGLWIGEDVVVSGTDVTSWPSRVGGTLAPITSTRTVTTVASRRSTTTSDLATVRAYTVAGSAMVAKAWIGVASIPTLPFGNYRVIVGSESGNGLAGKISTSTLQGTTTYVDGAFTNVVSGLSAGLHVLECDESTSTDVGVRLGGTATVPQHNWPESLSLAMCLDSVPTTLQRLQTQLILDTYYRPAQAPASKLALDLYGVYGADLVGLWIGEDLVVSGSDVTSWPGRVGGTLTPIYNTYTLASMGGRRALGPPPSSVGGQRLVLNSGVVSKTTVMALEASATVVSYETWEDTYATGEQTIIRDASTAALFTAAGQVTYVDGVASKVIPTSGVHTFEGYLPTRTGTGITLSGSNGAWERVAQSKIGTLIALSGAATTLQRLQTQYLLDTYYRPDQAPASKLALDLYTLFGDTITGLWIGEDLVTSGGEVTSWPGKIGPALTVTGSYLVRQFGGRTYTRASDATTAHYFAGTVSVAPLSFISIASVPSTISDGSSLVGGPAGAMLANNTSGLWYTTTGWAHYRNGSADETCVAATPTIFEASIASQADVNLQIAGRSTIVSRAWTTDFGFMMALSAVPSTLQRLQAQVLLDTYYRPERWAESKLVLDLYTALGADLIGLWIGEDLVVDGSGNVTSWPSRIGPTATPVSTGRFQRSVENGRSVAINSSTALEAGLAVTIAAPKASICVGRVSALPFSDYSVMALWGGGAQLGDSGLSTWFGTATHWTNGVVTNTANTALSVFESDITANTTPNMTIGGQSGTAARNWLGSIGLVMALSAIPTTLKRLQIQYLLDTYYRPSYAPAAKLALDLYQVSGLSINGLWVGEDLVLDGSNNVISWPGRLGTILTNVTANRFTYTTSSGGRKQLFTNSTSGKSLSASGGAGSPSIWAVITPSNSITSGETIADADISGGASAPLTRSSTTGSFSVGGDFDVHVINGISSEVIPTTGHLNIVEATSSLMAPPDYTLGGMNSGDSPWQGGVSLGMFLGAIPGAVSRASALLIIDNYYRVIASPQQQLTKSLLDIFGSAITGLWVGEDIVTSGSNITIWPGRVGPVLVSSGANPLTKSILVSRASTYNDSSTEVGLTATLSAAPKSLFAVIDLTSLPFVDTHVVAGSLAGPENIIAGEYTSTPDWMTNTGYTHYYNGTSSELAHTGPGVYEGVKAEVTATDLRVGGFGVDYSGYDFFGKIACVMSLSAIPSAGNRAAAVALLRSYYGF